MDQHVRYFQAAYGLGGTGLLVYDNFRAIMRWNKSTKFAAAVGYLADSMDRA